MSRKYDYMPWNQHIYEVVENDFRPYEGQIKTLKQLAFLMKQKGYRKHGKYYIYPTERQLKNAWDELVHEGIVVTKKEYEDFRTIEKIRNRNVVRDKKTGRFLKWIR